MRDAGDDRRVDEEMPRIDFHVCPGWVCEKCFHENEGNVREKQGQRRVHKEPQRRGGEAEAGDGDVQVAVRVLRIDTAVTHKRVELPYSDVRAITLNLFFYVIWGLMEYAQW